MKSLYKKLTSASFTFIASTHIALAQNVERPDWVNEASTDQVEAAGAEIMLWVGAFIAVIIGLLSMRCGWYFMQGEPEKGAQAGKDVLMGAVLSVVLGGIVFAVISYFN